MNGETYPWPSARGGGGALSQLLACEVRPLESTRGGAWWGRSEKHVKNVVELPVWKSCQPELKSQRDADNLKCLPVTGIILGG